MAHTALQQASDELRKAGELAEGDVQGRIHEHSTQLAKLATRDRGPDHGRLARHMTALDEIADDVGDDAAAHVRAAYDHLKEYRKGVEGI